MFVYLFFFKGEEVKQWRGSMGLLGIALALEIRIRSDESIRMSRTQQQTSPDSFGAQTFGDIKGKIRAYFEDTLKNNSGAEFYYDPYADQIDALLIGFDSKEKYDANSTTSYYKEEVKSFPNISYEGAQKDSPMGTIVKQLSNFISHDRVLGKLMMSFSRIMVNAEFEAGAIMPRDGFYLSPGLIVDYAEVHVFIKCLADCVETMLRVFEATRAQLVEWTNAKASDWYPSLPLQWRIITVQPNEMTLDNLEPGRWLSIELETLAETKDKKYEYSPYHYALERLWHGLGYKTRNHHGKAWGFGPVDGIRDYFFPFQNDTMANAFYNSSSRKAFSSLMEKHDPKGIFRAGAALRLLGLSKDKYTPKSYVGETCKDFESSQCIGPNEDISAGCCCNKLFVCASSWMKCVPTTKEKGQACRLNCECKANTCQWSFHDQSDICSS